MYRIKCFAVGLGHITSNYGFAKRADAEMVAEELKHKGFISQYDIVFE